MSRSSLAAFVWCLLAIDVVVPADDLFDGLTPGLMATYSAGDAQRTRVDADVSFNWGSASPIPELPRGAAHVEWDGVMLVKSDTSYQFSAFVQGHVQIEVDGHTVLSADSPQAAWQQGPATPLTFGFLPIKIAYDSTATAAVCQLFWSSELFDREPLPHHLLFHEQDDSQARLMERGRVLFDTHRCNRCHVRGDSLPSTEAPPFIAIAADVNPDWIVAKLQHQHPEAADSRMPSYGYNKEEATAIGAWLWAINQPPRIAPLRPAEPNKKHPPPDGIALVNSLGCLACHKVGELGTSGPYGGGDLSHIGAKRTADWIYTWLFQPDRINPERSMPQFKLSPTERSQIATALANLGRKEGMSFERPHFADNTVVVQQGRDLVRKARCYNCHKTPAVDYNATGLSKLNRPITDWSLTCLSETADPEHVRPYYPQSDRDALRAYVQLLTQSPLDEQDLRSPAERVGNFNAGLLALERRNCLACHERDGGAGIVETAGRAAGNNPQLRGLSEALIPPNLTAVGDKLRDDALARAVDGDPDPVRLPWLKVRMPKFNHTSDERKALVAYLIGHDRIPQDPARADSPPAAVADASEASSETLLLGRQLIGAGGFSCIACHKVGNYEPRNTALGTRGSDLKGIGQRVREEFYYRWTRAPLRVVPGMEMPSYEERPVKGLLDGNVHAQLSALWKGLNDPRFEAPTNPSQVEQLLTVLPGAPPRVLRDVFTVSKENGGGNVPRSFAIGFDNGHSLLFDLDQACVRDWTFGDFAHQRTEGKSWYWDLAGAPVVQGLPTRPEFVLQQGDQWIPLTSAADGRGAVLENYSADGEGNTFTVGVRYHLSVAGNSQHTVHVLERWRAQPLKSGRTAVERRVSVIGKTMTGAVYLVPAAVDARLLNARIELTGETTACGEFGAGVQVPIVSSPQNASDDSPVPAAVVAYTADYGTRPSEATPRPEFPRNTSPVTTAPGFDGVRLDVTTAMMPTGISSLPDGSLAVTSLKGDVILVRDSNGDQLPDSTQTFAAGLAAPFGVLASPPSEDGSRGQSLLVVHKPELLEVTDQDGDGIGEENRVLATGWGYTDNYHDWSAGPARDADGHLFVATSSDYAQPGRPEELCRWRGKVLKIDPDGGITPIAHELRYPMGIAFDPQGRLFVSDQQGVANCFNEINHIVPGARYGVKGLFDPDSDQPEQRAAIQIPHPWTRSVNGIFFVPGENQLGADSPLTPFAGHGVGCEYNNRFLIRFSLQEIEGQLQGATYLFTRVSWDNEAETFLGPICGTVAPNGDLFIGSIHDSGWLGGMNTGEIVRLRPNGQWPNGIRELRAVPDGFEIEFLKPVDPPSATQPENYSLSGYTRVWKGSYATEDSGRYEPKVQAVTLSDDHRTVRLLVDRLVPSYVYDIAVKSISADGQPLFPDVGYYTMNRVPKSK
ncbi:MAG: PA14 domain-containing protein [Planctomycetaceae bacterium]